MKSWNARKTWTAGAFAAIAAVVGVASPAAAAVDSTTTLQVSPPTAAVWAPVQLTATVVCPGDPSGVTDVGMTFFDGGEIMATVPVAANGLATYTARFKTAGVHTVTAAYNGNANCYASNDEGTVTVTGTPYCPWGTDPCRDDHAHRPGSPNCLPRTSTAVIDQPVDSRDECRDW
ncbi:Ig-like domain-containing protein [Streptomyces sp. NPDC005722]